MSYFNGNLIQIFDNDDVNNIDEDEIEMNIKTKKTKIMTNINTKFLKKMIFFQLINL